MRAGTVTGVQTLLFRSKMTPEKSIAGALAGAAWAKSGVEQASTPMATADATRMRIRDLRCENEIGRASCREIESGSLGEDALTRGDVGLSIVTGVHARD